MPPAPDAAVDRSQFALLDHLAAYGDRVALVTSDGELTYGDLAARVGRLVERLGGGRRLVLIAAANEVEPLVAYLAALSGGHPVLLVPGDNDDHVASMVSAYDPDVVFRNGGGGWHLTERRERSAHELHPDLALLLSTSGSTGCPKLVRLSRDNVWSNARSIAAFLGIRDTDRAATTLPIHYCYGLSVINSHLVAGAALVLTDLSVADQCFWELFRSSRATTFAGVPYTFDILDRCGFAELHLPNLRYVTQAGGRLAPSRVRAYAELGQRRGWDLFVMYGQTEATARMAYLPPDLALDRPHTIGVPIPDGSFRLDPAPGHEGGAEGELVYQGPNVMLGYADSPADLARGATVAELRTGDLARRGDDGLYELVGRLSRFAKVFGLRLDLEQVERTLADRGIRGWCISYDDQLVVVLPQEGVDRSDGDDARAIVAAHCGLPTRSVRVLRVDALPTTPSGKPDYQATERLARTVTDAERPGGHGAPGHSAATGSGGLRDLYSELLDRPDATEESSFVSLGGDSLSYVEMSVRLEDLLGPLPDDWHARPIRELASLRASGRRGRRTLETSVMMRALAIVLIVGTHANLFNVLGGAHVLLGIAGYNFARFQLSAVPRADRIRHGLTTVARVAVPSMAWIGAVHLLVGGYAVSNVFFLNGVFGSDKWTREWQYWFLEALVWTLLLLVAMCAIPRVDRAERRRPFAFALGALAIAVAARFAVTGVEAGPTERYTPSVVLFFFALGWAAAKASRVGQRLLLTGITVAAVAGFFGDLTREGIVVAGLLGLLWVPRLPCPRLLTGVVQVLASASLYIYVTHWQVYPHLEDDYPVLAVLASVGCGIAYWALTRRVARRIPPAWSLAGGRRYPPSGRQILTERLMDGTPDVGQAWGAEARRGEPGGLPVGGNA